MSLKFKMFMLMLIGFIVFPMIAFADTGPKPSIDISIKNLNTTNYVIDLFVFDKNGDAYESNKNYNAGGLTEEQINKLYELNFDGWISESTRWDYYILFADCAGNSGHSHHFSYFGTPERYKIVIINYDTGEIKISDEIVRDTFNSSVTIDYNTMTSTINNNYSRTIIIALICLIVTIGVELLIAYVFKIGHYKIISIANIITNIGLQLALVLLFNNFLITFIIGEVLVILVELAIYLLKFKDISKLKTIIYSLTANIVTILISLLLYKI